MTGISKQRRNPQAPSQRSGRRGTVRCRLWGGSLTALLAVALTGSLGAPSRAAQDQVHFVDGDSLRGRIVSAAPDTPVAFVPEGSAQEAKLHLPRIARIEFAPETETAPSGDSSAGTGKGSHILRFQDGTVLTGSPVWMDERLVALDSTAAGPLQAPRAQLLQLARRLPDPRLVYSGPETAWEETNQGQNWSFHEGALYSNEYSSTALPIDLPQRFLFEFDVSTRGQVNLNVSVGAPDKQNIHTDAYLIQITAYSINLRRNAKRERGAANYSLFSQHQAREMVDAQTPSPINRFQFFFDFEKGHITMFRDGEFLGSGAESEGFNPPQGDTLSFTCYGGGRGRVSRIRLIEWDGTFPSSPKPGRAEEESLRLMNGDVLTGKLEELRDGACAFATPFAALRFPFSEVREYSAPTLDPTTAPAPGAVAVVLLHNGDRIGLTALRVEKTAVSGTSPVAGNIQVPRSSVRSIDFLAEASSPELSGS